MRNNRFIASILIGAFVLLFVPVSARADDAAALLAKHKAFVGWSYGDGAVRSLSLAGQYVDKKGVLTGKSVENRLGLAYRRSTHSTVTTFGESTGFTGNLFWVNVGNGFTVPEIGDTAKSDLIVDVLFMEGTSELPGTLVGPATVNGKAAQIVRVTMGGAFPMDIYVDPDTGAYLRAVVDPGGSNEETINIHSYSALDGTKKMIGSWSLGDSTAVYSYTKLLLNPQIGAAQLHPPAPSATWTFANPNPFPIKVTADRVYVDATVNGTKGRFIVDTGDGGITFTDEFANRANVKTIESSDAIGIGGETKTLVRKVDAFVIGGNTLSNLYVSTINQKFNDKDYGERVDGFVGFDLFGGAIVRLTLSNQTMTIGDPASTAVDGNSGIQIVPDLSDGTPQIPVKLSGKIDAIATLDSGGYDFVLISRLVERRGVTLIAEKTDLNGNSNTFLGGNRIISGVGGDESVLCGVLGTINIGPITYGDINACESANYSLNQALIGFDFMKNFDFVFDYPHGRMILTPHKN